MGPTRLIELGNRLLRPKLVWPAECEDVLFCGHLQLWSGGWGKENKRMSEGDEELECEDAVLFTEGGHVPDHFRGAKT